MHSLVKQDDQQLRLFSSEQMDDSLFAEAESRGEFTGARLFSSRPEVYKSIIALSAEGIGAIRIGKILGVSPNTVLAVRAREGGRIDIEKTRVSLLSREAARMCVEGIIEMLSDPDQAADISARDKGVIAGILIDKAELLSGAPTTRIETTGAQTQEVAEYLSWLKSEYAVRVSPEMGLEGEKDCPNAGADRLLPAAPGDDAGPAQGDDAGLADAEQAADDLPRSTAGGVDCGAEQEEIVNRGANGEGRVFNPPAPERAVNIDRDCGGGDQGGSISCENSQNP